MRSGRSLALLAVLLAAGCANLPTGGPVQVGRTLPPAGSAPESDIHVLPSGPLPGMSRTEIVRGFLHAMANDDADYEIARAFLTSGADAKWDPRAHVTTYDDSDVRITRTETGAVRFAAPRVGLIDQRGSFTPLHGTLSSTFRLRRDGGQWRISALPDGALLSTADAQRSFEPADVYYPNLGRDRLVPEPVLVRRDPRGLATALVNALVQGPGRWLAPAVRTAFPAGTDLAGTVPIDAGGVAEVNLTPAAQKASPTAVELMTAQLAWTLRQIPGVTGMRILVDGAQLPATPPVAAVQDTWSSYDPAPAPTVPGAFFQSGSRWRPIGAVPSLSPSRGLTELAMTGDGTRYAGLRATRDGVALVVGGPGGGRRSVLTASAISPPAFTPDGSVLVVLTARSGPDLAWVAPNGRVTRMRAPGSLRAGAVRDLRVSSDGARVAVLAGAPGRVRLFIGRLTKRGERPAAGAFRAVLPAAAHARGLAWSGADQVVVTAKDASGGREVLAVDVTGYSVQTLPTAGVAGPVVDVAAAPARPMLVEAGGVIWAAGRSGGWRRVGAGVEPTYPG